MGVIYLMNYSIEILIFQTIYSVFDVSKLIRSQTLNIPEYLTTEMGIFLSSINDMQSIIWSFNHELCILKFELLSAGSDKNHAGDST